jgi:FixJ family two-component response regulator
MKIQPIVLVVDDDHAVLTAMEEILKSRASFKLLTACTYSAALEMLLAAPSM